MNSDEIVKQAGSDWQKTRGTMREYIEGVIALTRADEREKCINVVEKMMGDWQLGRDVIATLRGEK